jgi:hypothetical protein
MLYIGRLRYSLELRGQEESLWVTRERFPT